MLKIVKRLISYPQMIMNIPELKIELKNCLIAELAPYQTINANPEFILFHSHEIKAEGSKIELYSLTNFSKSKLASVGFHFLNGPVSISSNLTWKVNQGALILTTSKTQLSTNEDFFIVSGEGSALISGVQMLELEEEVIYLPKNKLSAVEDRLNLQLGLIQGQEHWKISGTGKVLVGSGCYKSEDSKDLPEFILENDISEPEDTQNNDILINSL